MKQRALLFTGLSTVFPHSTPFWRSVEDRKPPKAQNKIRKMSKEQEKAGMLTPRQTERTSWAELVDPKEEVGAPSSSSFTRILSLGEPTRSQLAAELNERNF